MNTIDSYHFGEIVIDGEKYSSDIVIFSDRVRDNWWRKTGHELCLEDIAEVIADNPDVLLVGTGASGLMKVLPEVKQEAKARHIQFIVEPTSEACNTYNQLCQSQRVVAAFHLTC
ncbi:Mth938-like domain-containing protein [Chloroflexota bacterium]